MIITSTEWEGLALAQGRYIVKRKLGRGGMSVVYLAWDRTLDVEVAVKVPNEALLRSPSFAFRFPREVRSLVKLSHPHVVKIGDVGQHGGIPYMVMQYLPGGTLARRRVFGPNGKPKPLPPESLSSWLGSIASALDFVHKQNHIHRDVKPGNILFDGHGHAYLSDFGLVKTLAADEEQEPADSPTRELVKAELERGEPERNGPEAEPATRQGSIVGTLPYMAPEVLLRSPYDGRADQYSLAVVVYEILSGRWPFPSVSHLQLMHLHMSKNSAPLAKRVPGLPEALTQAVHRGLAKEPASRFASCFEFAASVLEAIEAQPARVSASVPAQPAAARVAECPNCGSRLRLFPELLGQSLRCGHCKAKLRVGDDWRVVAVEPLPEVEPSPADSVEPQPSPESEASSLLSIATDPEPILMTTSRQRSWRVVILAAMVLATVGLASGFLLKTWIGRANESARERRGPRGESSSPEDKAVIAAVQGRGQVPTGEVEALKNQIRPKLEKADPSQPRKVRNPLGMDLILVDSGHFPMGSPASDESARRNETPRREVSITKPFYLGEREVTVAQFRQFVEDVKYGTIAEKNGGFAKGRGNRMPSDGDKARNWRSPGFPQTDDHPALFIDWDSAVAFCDWLSQREGQRYRLPTEAEWEYACRAGSNSFWSFGADPRLAPDYAHAARASAHDGPIATGSLKPNAWGFYDMHGNAAEWCLDGYHERYHLEKPNADPRFEIGGVHYRVLRGGSFASNTIADARSAARDGQVPNNFGMEYSGFRVLKEIHGAGHR